jgi:hypothetical protein
MPTKEQLEKQLNQLPPDTPPDIDPDLVRMHQEFHLAGKIDESVPHSYLSVPGMSDLGRLITDLTQLSPSHLRIALEIHEDLLYQTEIGVFSDWSSPVLNLLVSIYRDHYPPEKIHHRI